MGLTWLDPDNLAERDVAGAVALLGAADALDWPHEPPRTVTSFIAGLRYGWDGDPSLVALATNDRGRVTGVLEVSLTTWDNTHLGTVRVTVDPVLRRQGIGRQLFGVGVDHVRQAGRRLVIAESLDRADYTAFAAAVGLEKASVEVVRMQNLNTLDREKVERDHLAAGAHTAAYELVRVAGATPPELLDDLAVLSLAINDAPLDDYDIEDEVYSPKRLVAFDTAQIAAGRRIYRLIARERATGVLAGHTVVAVEAESPGFAAQLDTSVVAAHRGHRLGLWLKTAMLRWLEEAEPQLRTLLTWNAASNTHMVAVNEALGYRVATTVIGWQRAV